MYVERKQQQFEIWCAKVICCSIAYIVNSWPCNGPTATPMSVRQGWHELDCCWRVPGCVWHALACAGLRSAYALRNFAISWAYELRFARRFRLRTRIDETDLMTLKSPLKDDLSFIVIFNDYSSFIGYHVVSKPRIGFSFRFLVHWPYYVPYNFHVRCSRRFVGSFKDDVSQ